MIEVEVASLGSGGAIRFSAIAVVAVVAAVGLATSIALPVGGARTDSTPCPANRNPGNLLPCGIVYGPGGRVERQRGSRVDREIGLGLQLLDINVTGSINFFDTLDVAVRLGK